MCTGTGGQCSGPVTLTAPSGSISDGPGNYSPSQSCSWTASTGSIITLSFNSFRTESGYDYVKVYDGSSSSGYACVFAHSSCIFTYTYGRTQLGSFSGSSIPGSVTATSGSMYITFSTDSSSQYSGFEATYSSSGTSAGGSLTSGPLFTFCQCGVEYSPGSIRPPWRLFQKLHKECT